MKRPSKDQYEVRVFRNNELISQAGWESHPNAVGLEIAMCIRMKAYEISEALEKNGIPPVMMSPESESIRRVELFSMDPETAEKIDRARPRRSPPWPGR